MNMAHRLLNGAQGVGGVVDALYRFAGTLAGRIHPLHRSAGLSHEAVNHTANLISGFRTAFGQLAHFIGNHRKTAAMLAGPGRFNRRIEGQQVGLVSDGVDDIQYLGNLVGFFSQVTDAGRTGFNLLRQLVYRSLGVSNGLAAIPCKPVCVGGRAFHRVGIAGNLLDRGRHFVNG